MVGSAIVRKLESAGYDNIVTRTSKELDLRDQRAVNEFFAAERPDYVFLAAAKVGGIMANNTYRGQFLYDNLMIEANIIEAARVNEVTKLQFLGSSCIYPKLAPQPLTEDALLTGPLESTNEPYAIAKITGIKLCDAYRAEYGCDFISVMPTNLYGPNDNYDLKSSHVLPALIRKFHEAKKNGESEVVMWGTGSPKREFLHADDLAEACVFLMQEFSDYGFVNVGTGEDLSILSLAEMIKQVVGYEGKITKDPSKPDGTPRKLMNVEKLHGMGWRHSIELREGIERVYAELESADWY
jgi:GDP-L-fucose synthase